MAIVVLALGGACSTSNGTAAESAEFQAEWNRVVGAGVEVQRVAPMSVIDPVSGALGASATDGVTALLSTAIPGAGRGPLTPPEVNRSMRERMSSIRMCQAQASRRTALPSGKVIVRFSIANSGIVENVQVDGPAFSGTPLLGCIASAVRRLQFRPSTGQPFAAAFPFIFAGS